MADLTVSSDVDTMMGSANNAAIRSNIGAVSEGTEVLSTGETGGTKFLREDGDGTCSWQAVSSGTGIAELGIWYLNNVSSSQTNQQMSYGSGGGISGGAGSRKEIPFAGNIRGIGANTSAGFSSGTVTFTVFKNGVATALTTTLTGGSNRNSNTNAGISFAANDDIDVRITTDTITPSGSAEIIATVYVEWS
jgi:hypothetical protein